MKIEITTRQLIHMVKTGYLQGIKHDQTNSNHGGTAEDVAKRIIMDKLGEDDYIIQQS